MGLFDFLKKSKPSGQTARPSAPKAHARRPETYEELVDDLLTNQSYECLSEDRKAIVYNSIGPRQVSDVGERMRLLSELLDKTREEPRAEINYEYVINVLQDYRYLIGETDWTLKYPQETERLSQAIVDFYQQGGPFVREKLEYNAESMYNVGFDALRGLDALLLEDEAHRDKVLSHMDSVDSTGKAFCLLDVLVRHRQDASDAAASRVLEHLKQRLHPILLLRLTGAVPEGKVEDFPEYFRRVYLPLNGGADDAALADWFDGYWKA